MVLFYSTQSYWRKPFRNPVQHERVPLAVPRTGASWEGKGPDLFRHVPPANPGFHAQE